MPGFTAIRMSIPHDAQAEELARLKKELQAITEDGWAEVAIDKASFPALYVLVNGKNACLSFFRYDGDPGFFSMNPEHEGKHDIRIEFELSNGQTDEYPLDCCYQTTPVKQAILHFARTGKVPDWLKWGNAGFDGRVSPNDPFEIPP